MNKAASWIAKKRKEKNLSLRELGNLTGLSHVTISKAEDGDASWDTWITLAKFFNEDENSVLAWAGKKSDKSENDELDDEALFLMRQIKSRDKKRMVVKLIRTLSEEDGGVSSRHVTE